LMCIGRKWVVDGDYFFERSSRRSLCPLDEKGIVWPAMCGVEGANHFRHLSWKPALFFYILQNMHHSQHMERYSAVSVISHYSCKQSLVMTTLFLHKCTGIYVYRNT
jgi:hypothetical protein